ncbi:MAG: DUF2271 domain-containing protein [bacterium]
MKRTRNLMLSTVLTLLLMPYAKSKSTSLPGSAGGTVQIEVTTITFDGRYSPKNIGAIWVEDAQERFVKSLEVWARKRIRHLIKWQASSAGNVVDAVTSATFRSHQTHTATWDCTDVNGAQVPDGTYKVLIEFTEENSSSSGKPPGKWTVIEFTKGAGDQTITPPDETYFRDLRLTYTNAGVQPASVSGTVKEAGSSLPIGAATVQLKSGSTVSYETVTDNAGAYQFNDVQPGSYNLVCFKSGYVTWTESISVSSGQVIAGKDIQLTPQQTDTTPPAPPQNVKAVVQ